MLTASSRLVESLNQKHEFLMSIRIDMANQVLGSHWAKDITAYIVIRQYHKRQHSFHD